MSEPDVVAELDAWPLEISESNAPGDEWILGRARDEIVALRDELRRQEIRAEAWRDKGAAARAEALDDAMRSCVMLARSMRKVDSDASFGAGILAARAAISALKDKRDE